MIKKFVLIGVILVIAAIVVFFLTSYLLTNSLGGKITMLNSTVAAGGYHEVRINYTNSTTIIALYTLISAPINLYVMNASAYSEWSGYMAANANASGVSEAGRLNLGAQGLFTNKTAGMVPIETNGVGGQGTQGSVYVVMDNTHGSTSSAESVNATLWYVPVEKSGILISAAIGYSCFILGIAGIILIIYGLVKKGKQAEEQKAEKEKSDKAYVDRLYRNVKKRNRQ